MTHLSREVEADGIARRLADVAIPDSRFHRDFTRFIPGFPGSDRAAAWALTLLADRTRGPVFCTLEASLWEVRQGLLARGFDVVMPTYGLHRGLVLLSASIASAQHRFATCLDGAEMMGTRLSPDHRFAHPAPLFFCGASAVTAAGIRFGMGAGYIDVEWWICRALGLANEGTEVVAVVDRCQVSDARFAPEVDELPCTYIATQDGLLATGATARPSRPPKLDFDPSLAANPQVLAAFALLSDGD